MNTAKDNGANLKTARRISAAVLYASVALIAVVFGAFFLFGTDSIYGGMLSPVASMLTDAVIINVYILIAAATALAAWSMARSMKNSSEIIDKGNLINSTRIKRGIFAFVCLCLVITFAISPDEPININGTVFNNRLLLKMTDMFINTTLILVTVATGGLFYGMSGHIRKRK